MPPTHRHNLFSSLRYWTQRHRMGHNARTRMQSALDGASVAPPADDGQYRAGVTLDELQPGECGTIRRLLGATRGRLRLMEMGLTPGTHVKVIRRAPFGGPLDVLVRGYQLSLRRDEAAALWLDDEAA